MIALTKRTTKIICTLAQYLLLYRLTRYREKPLGRRLREACERLGPTFIKFGQVLSTRSDILSIEDCTELQHLLDNVAPFPYHHVEGIIQQDFGSTPDQLFATFTREPLASASVAQVHRATLHTGEEVAVKVRRPFIGKPIEQDVALLRNLTQLAQLLSPTLRGLQVLNVVEEINAALLKEIDFRNETRNLLAAEQYTGHFAQEPVRKDLGRIIIPKVYPALSSPNIITMEFLEGVTLKEHAKLTGNPEYDAVKSVKTVLNGSTRQMFEDTDYFFHADPHPSNLLVMKHGDIGLLDFGIIGFYKAHFARKANDLFFAVYTRDPEMVTRAALNLAGRYDPGLARQILPDIKAYLEQTESEGIGYWFIGIVKIFVRHRIRFPHELTMLGRSNVILDGLLKLLGSTESTIEIVGPELRRGIRRRMLRNVRDANYTSVLYLLTEKFRSSPEKVNRVIDQLAEDPLALLRSVREELGSFA